MQDMMRGCRRAAGALTLVAGFVFVAIDRGLIAQERSAGPETGWSGERMPEGMRRGAKEKEYVWEKDQSILVYVPSGKFRMGCDDPGDDALPVHEVELSAFYIDKYEATWGQWKRSGLPMPEAPRWGIQDDHPVVNVSWEDAKKYCDWAGRRLPTEAEWEYAARGPEGRKYPWGNEEPTDALARFDQPWDSGSTKPVGSYPKGASWCGAMDLTGNAWEWCEDWFDDSFYARSPSKDPRNDKAAKDRVLRGGSWETLPAHLRAACRFRDRPGVRLFFFGFRAVVSARAP